MPFFDASSASTSDVTTYLPKRLRDDADLARVAALAEQDVLEVYTVELKQQYLDRPLAWWQSIYAYYLSYNSAYLCLRGYDPDPAKCEPNLAKALKREIAEVVVWRMAQKDVNPLATSESATQALKGYSFREDKNSSLPPNFGYYLRRYDVRPTAYTI